MADSYATLEAERVRLHGRSIVARVAEIDGGLVIQVKDSRNSVEKQATEQSGTWVTYADATASQAVFT